ncbi:hypothetical protein [Paenibacillus silviterrae]|uniref:hypothetical protein n=1 Tax=Paenibacillus silviterrae TaxID=3242194 RepID=UPI002543E3D8|nr:hypothetical protein [Paenibacillus chinjuensis]
MKICILGSLAAALLAAGTGIVWGSPVQAETKIPVGTPVGTVLSTDIRADINGEIIPSLNIDGYTAVIAEDLRRYGFDVAWIPKERRVDITYTPGKAINPLPGPPLEPSRVGEKLADVVSTDIRVYYAGKLLPSYNIGGHTAISLNDLSSFGQIEWKEQERKLSYSPSWNVSNPSLKDSPPLVLRQTKLMELGPFKITGPDVLLDGAAFGLVAGDDPMLPTRQLAEKLGYKADWQQDGSLVMDDGTNRFHIVPGLSAPELTWLGGEAESFEWYRTPVAKSGEVYIHEQDARSLFGCSTELPDSTNGRTFFSLRCPEYQVEDHGVPQAFPGLRYGLQAAAYLDDSKLFIPTLQLTNSVQGQRQFDNRFHVRRDGVAEGGLVKYTLAAEAQIDIDDNNMILQITDGHKTLYRKAFAPEVEVSKASPTLKYSDIISHGTYSHIRLSQPALIYSETADDLARLSGSVEQAVGGQLRFVVEKRENDGYREVWRYGTPLTSEQFEAELPLPSGQGIYRIRILSEEQVDGRSIQTEFDIAHLFINKTAGEPFPSPVDPNDYHAPASTEAARIASQWNFGSYPVRYTGYDGYPLSLSFGSYGLYGQNTWLGTPVDLKVRLTNVGEEPITLSKPVELEAQIVRYVPKGETNEFQIVWHGLLPALSGSLQPLGYAELSFRWDMLDDDGKLVPPGQYTVQAKLPMTLEFTKQGENEKAIQEMQGGMRTRAPIFVLWPNE